MRRLRPLFHRTSAAKPRRAREYSRGRSHRNPVHERRNADSAENNWPSYLSTSHYEVAKYYTVDEHTRVPEMILMSKMTFDKLTAEDQAIIKEAAKEAALFERDAWAKTIEEAEAKIVENGNIITRLDSKDAFQKSVMPLYDKYGADYKDLIQQIIDTK